LGLYLGARLLGLAAKVEPANLAEHWWTIPVLLLFAVKAALLEETILLSYLQTRLASVGVGLRWRVFLSAGLRGSYHLYQGFAGLVGNFVMGLAFAWLFERWRAKNPNGSALPFVIAHFLLDAFVFVGYSLLDLSHVLP
jgi:membrane protease YdiL (CAAX protease family)